MKIPLLAGVLWLLLGAGALAAEPAAETPTSQAPSVRKACTADAKTYCHGVLPGLGRLKSCMKKHYDELSEACKTAVTAAEAKKAHSAPPPSPQ